MPGFPVQPVPAPSPGPYVPPLPTTITGPGSDTVTTNRPTPGVTLYPPVPNPTGFGAGQEANPSAPPGSPDNITGTGAGFQQPANPGQIDPTTFYQILSQLIDPAQISSYAQQAEASQAGLAQESLQTNEQVQGAALQEQLYGLQGAQAKANLGFTLQNLGLSTGAENQSYTQALQSLAAQLGSTGMAASGQAGNAYSQALATHQRNLAGLALSGAQAKSDTSYTEQQVGMEQQQQELQAALAKAIYAGDVTSAGRLMNLLQATSALTQDQSYLQALPDLGLALGPGVPTGTAGSVAKSTGLANASGQFNSVVSQLLGMPVNLSGMGG